MKKLTIILVLSFFSAGFALQQHAATQIVVPKSVYGNGGDVLSNSEYRMVGTLGQPFIGITQNPSNVNSVGFWYLATLTVITDVDETSSSVPGEFRLQQNYPNPFNPTTTITYNVREPSHVTLRIYNVAGQLVKTLVDDVVSPSPGGLHNVIWYGDTNTGEAAASGVYFYKLVTPGFTKTRKMVLLK